MIFLGDIVSPTPQTSADFLSSLKEANHVFNGNCVIGNLEGLISDVYYKIKRPVLSNHPSVIEPLKLINTRAVSLANNHTLDLPFQLEATKELLAKNNIGFFGAGKTKEEADTPARINYKGFEFFILGYSWGVLMQHQKNTSGVMYVNPIRPKEVLLKISQLRKEHPKAKIIMKMHWSFDLETIPFPLHRSFSRAMIDAGANAVIGSHSHCVQGGERYNNGIIVYGLGNFFFPWYIFTSGESYFPDWTKTELAVQWDPESNQTKCHWFEYNYSPEKHELKYLKTEEFDDGELINRYSPFRNMDQKQYISWYKKNRRKGLLIPVYRHHEDIVRNQLIDFYLKKRIRFARFLAETGLRAWKR